MKKSIRQLTLEDMVYQKQYQEQNTVFANLEKRYRKTALKLGIMGNPISILDKEEIEKYKKKPMKEILEEKNKRTRNIFKDKTEDVTLCNISSLRTSTPRRRSSLASRKRKDRRASWK